MLLSVPGQPGERLVPRVLADLVAGLADVPWRDGVIALSCGLMLWFPAGRVVDLAYRARSYGDQTEYLQIPTFYMGMFIAAMTFLTSVILIMRGLLYLFAPRLLEPTK